MSWRLKRVGSRPFCPRPESSALGQEADVAIVRLEQFYPFPESQLKEVFQKYRQAKKWNWVQEEPQNMGGWQFLQPLLKDASGKLFTYIGRKASSSTASGFPGLAKLEQQAIVAQALGPPIVRKGKGKAAAG